MQHAQHKLHDLQLRDVALEGIVDLQAGQQVVRVHERMHDAVQPRAEEYRPVGVPEPQQQTPDRPDGRMMVEMKERELLIAFARYDEEGVEEIEVLGEVVNEKEKLQAWRVLLPQTHYIWKRETLAQTYRHPCAKNHLNNVVEQHQRLQVETRLFLHYSAKPEHEREVEHTATA